jgi:PAS domain S-box-containing protein
LSAFKVGEGLGIITTDITDRRLAEEALKASEAKYRSFLEEGLDGVVVTWNGEYLYVNQRYVEMLGYSDPSELLGRNTSELIDPRDAERLDAVIEQRQKGDMQRLVYEVRSLKKDGSSIWVGVASSGIEFEGNQAVITYARDITERKRMEEEVRSLARFPGESANPVLRISGDGVIMYTNAAAESVLAEWKKKVGMKAPEEWIRYVSAALEKGIQDIEIIIDDRMLSMRIMPIEDAGYVNVYSRDVTDQKRMEECLLTAERLAVVGRIAAMMGHDLRGPLMVIRNAVDLARKKPERTDKMLDMIERNAGQAIDLLEELRTRTKEDPVTLAPVEIGELLRKATENILLPEGVELHLEIDDTLPELLIDEAKTLRALDNVIRNAFDAMPAGGVLKIGATREGDEAVIRISDTGPGIPEDTLENLFEPFYTTKPGGLGLGLTSTKRMVDVQGGTISVETSDGEGATFAIALPLKGKNPGR